MADSLQLPYLRKLDRRGDIAVWIVDGSHVRGHLDEEFTNFGQHYRYPYIPEKEFWIDEEAEHDEYLFFIDHLLLEHRLMAQGQQLPDGRAAHDRLWKKLENGISVWIVNGRFVRSVFDIDFTAGGHDHVYEFVPTGEVWIDDAITEKERGFVLLHELHERNRMQTGIPYSPAHAESSKVEFHCRHHPDELHDALAIEGWA